MIGGKRLVPDDSLSPLRCLIASRTGIFIFLGLISLLAVILNLQMAGAAQLNQRNLTISSAQPSVNASHSFQLTPATAGNLGSIVFEYCDNTPVFNYACNAPPGLDVSGASLASQSGNVGFSIDAGSTTANKLVLTRPSIATITSSSQYVFSGIVNPSTADHVNFVRISTYATTDASGPFTDNGAVAFAIVSPFNVGANVPPFMRLCVGITVTVNCSSASGTTLDLGTFKTSSASAGQSQFSAGTNSINGYSVFILGTTMTSGNNSLPALSNQTPSFPGNSQFGVNLRANTNPSVGQDPSGPGTAAPAAGYNVPNLFKFHSGDALVSDAIPSDFKRMTVSYLVNISSSQSPGIYSTTFTYLATATF